MDDIPDFEVDAELAARLVAAQFPGWAHLPVRPVPSSGTANALFRLGEDLVLRFPRTQSAILAVTKEQAWLPRLARHLGLAVPVPVAQGSPEAGYRWPWSVYGWLQGDDLWTHAIGDLHQAAVDLAGFITRLQAVDAAEGPAPGRHNSHRGEPLVGRDPLVRKAIVELGERIDARTLTREWEIALDQPRWDRSVWIHGDLQPGNLLAREGKLAAVIDFGLLGVGDPACDLLPAWNLLDRDSRRTLRSLLQVDDATWERGRGWALYQSLLALPYYWDTNEVMVRMAWRQITELFADRRES